MVELPRGEKATKRAVKEAQTGRSVSGQVMAEVVQYAGTAEHAAGSAKRNSWLAGADCAQTTEDWQRRDFSGREKNSHIPSSWRRLYQNNRDMNNDRNAQLGHNHRLEDKGTIGIGICRKDGSMEIWRKEAIEV